MARFVDLDKQLVRLYRLNLDCEEVVKQFLLTADVIEVVRCKDCKYWYPQTDCNIGYCCDLLTSDENGFCSWGERREDGVH